MPIPQIICHFPPNGSGNFGLDETIGVLRDKFRWDGYRLHLVREQLARIANRVEPTKNVAVIKEDPDDNRVIECALEAVSDFIITADKDLLRLGNYQGIQIVRAVDFLHRVTVG